VGPYSRICIRRLNYVLARAVDWNGWSGRRLVGTRKAKVKYIGPSPDPKEERRQHLLLDTEAGVAWSTRNIANRAGEVDGTV